MPSKGQKGGSAKGKQPKEEQRERALQAVVLTDSFEKRFAPFTLDRPRCLLPLANVPLIEYTLEFLAHAGVEEIFVYCGAHADQVQEYLNASKWKKAVSPFAALEIIRATVTSVGDAMRDLDGRGLITSDFLLIIGDVICNVPLEPALARHRARREKDKNAIMTMILREAGPEHRTTPQRNRPVFAIAPQTNRCLWYDEVWHHSGHRHYLEFDPELLREHADIEIRSDLIDCGIDICTPEVLSQWSENFDFNSPRRGFLRGVMKDYELNGKTFHTHILRSGYAARVRSLRTYDAISRDIIARWTYPLTPDSNVFAGQNYQLGKDKVYMEDKVSLARGSSVQRRSIVAHGTSIGDNSLITDSVIGPDCHIGSNVPIRGAYIWSKCRIGDKTVIENAVVAEGVSIGKDCAVTAGCLIGMNVQIGDDTKLAERSRLTGASHQANSKELAHHARRAYHSPSSSSGDSSPAGSPLVAPTARRDSIDTSSSISTLHSQPSAPSSRRTSSVSHDHPFRLSADGVALGTSPETALLTGSAKAAAAKAKLRRDFVGEATASVYDGLAAHEPADKIRLELVAQRLAADAADTGVRDALVAAFLLRTWALLEAASDPLTPANAVKAVWSMDTYGFLLAQMGMFDTGATSPAAGGAYVKPDQVAVLRTIEAAAADARHAKGKEVLLFVVREGVEGGWLQMAGIEEWWAGEGQPAGSGIEAAPKVRALVKTYVEYLMESEEESSEEESEEESE